MASVSIRAMIPSPSQDFNHAGGGAPRACSVRWTYQVPHSLVYPITPSSNPRL